MATGTMWTAVLGAVFEKGTWNTGDTIATLFCIIGLVLITQPGPLFDDENMQSQQQQQQQQQHKRGDPLLGYLAALMSAISHGFLNLTIRRIKDEDTSVVTIYGMVS